MPAFVQWREALDADRLGDLRASLLGSPLVGQSTLAGSFRASHGFAVTFTAAGRQELLSRYAVLEPFLEAAEARRAQRALAPWPLRWRRFAAANAWYLNLLVLRGGRAVGRHVDATLRGPSGDAAALPLCVSVLYLQVPPGRGGALRLFRGPRPLGHVEPREGTLVHFQGDLDHEVSALEAAPEDALRASLVLEQYALPPAALAALPPFRLDSRAGFGAYLADHARRPPRPQDLDGAAAGQDAGAPSPPGG